MSEHTNEEQEQHPTSKRSEMSRRQFLNYTLGGTGAFLVGIPLVWNLRFAVDPLLQPKTEAKYVRVVEESKITTTPTIFKFKVQQIDGWYYSEPDVEAWIMRDEKGEIYALSPTCKHLGCTIDWEPAGQAKNEFHCPCHGARYTIDGKELAVAPAPLDQYSIKLEGGFVYLGQIHANTRVKGA